MEDYSTLSGKTQLYLGDVGTGKTYKIAAFLYYLFQNKTSPQIISLFDFAPATIEKRGKKIGGTVYEVILENKDHFGKTEEKFEEFMVFLSKIRFNGSKTGRDFTKKSNFIPPRSHAKTSKDVAKAIWRNHTKIDKTFAQYFRERTPIALINDASMVIHGGDFHEIFRVMKRAKTCIINAYYGDSLVDDKNSGLSAYEKEWVEHLRDFFEYNLNCEVIQL